MVLLITINSPLLHTKGQGERFTSGIH